MLKKMRRRFVTVAMCASSAVILVLLIAINAWNYRTVSTQLDMTISMLQIMYSNEDDFPDNSESGEVPAIFPVTVFSPEFQYMIRFFSVTYSEDGTVSEVNQDFIASVSRDDAIAYADAVTAGNRSSGYYNGYRFQVSSANSGTLVVFLNAERELQTIRTLLITTSIVTFLCLLAVFLLAFLFSNRAIAPFARNIATQKEFITNASHELKTPLTSISTSADVLAMEYPEDEWVQNIRLQSGRMASLVSNLVMLSRLDEDRPLPEKSEFSLSDLAWEVSEPFVSRAKAAGKQLTADIADNVTVTADESSVRQLLSVLLDNALKYSDEGGRISLRVCQSGKKVCIEVCNPCAGCASLNTAKLFDRFYRADASNNKIGGSGIGLSIAKAAAEANGGSISAETKRNEILFRVLL